MPISNDWSRCFHIILHCNSLKHSLKIFGCTSHFSYNIFILSNKYQPFLSNHFLRQLDKAYSVQSYNETTPTFSQCLLILRSYFRSWDAVCHFIDYAGIIFWMLYWTASKHLFMLHKQNFITNYPITDGNNWLMENHDYFKTSGKFLYPSNQVENDCLNGTIHQHP